MRHVGAICLGLLVWAMMVVACTPVAQTATTVVPVVTVPPTETVAAATITPDPSPTPENCNTGWNWASGTAPAEFAQAVQGMMVTAQISGTVNVSTFGENDACGRYHAMSTDFAFTVPVPDPVAETSVAPLAETLLQLAQTANQSENRPAPNLGNIEIAFENASQRCYWRRSGNEWNTRCEAVGN